MADKPKHARNRISSSNLFLMELILALLLFSVAGAASISVFSQASHMSDKAGALDRAADYSASVAELIRGSATIREALTAISETYPDAELTTKYGTLDETFSSGFEPYDLQASFWFDKDGSASGKHEAAYVVKVSAEQTDAIIEANIRCFPADEEGEPAGEEISYLPVTHYVRRPVYE